MKENKEPSPKVKRRRSVKISNVALMEPALWQNDALQILTSINDYRSMNDFLMKKVATCSSVALIHWTQTVDDAGKRLMCRHVQISDLDTEDSKKDTMVDVVFKKALKEFRLNIFNSYSTALAVSSQCEHNHLYNY